MKAAIRQRLAIGRLRRGPSKGYRRGIPPEGERIEILARLVKAKALEGVWYNGLTLMVRPIGSFGIGTPVYLSWGDAVKVIQSSADCTLVVR